MTVASSLPDMPLTPFDKGATPLYAFQGDTRLSYCLYVPKSHTRDGTNTYPLIVAVHGTERGATEYRDGFSEFAETHQAIVLAPLFPANLFFIGDLENYKLLHAGGVRFDLALLSMIDEAAARYRMDADKFLMFGFSGGGHFAHRFLYTHPDRLKGVCIGAPGVVTLANPNLKYPLGLNGMADFLGGPIQPENIPDVPIHCVVGAEDTYTRGITVLEGSEVFWTPGINDTGLTRIDRLNTLAQSLRDAGCDVTMEIVPGCGHDPRPLIPSVQSFFKRFFD